jgi:hypothetical protein
VSYPKWNESQLETGALNLQVVVRELEKRLEAIEGKLWPAADGSGTERYADGSGTERYADNWTQVSNGKDYPGSYGVGPEGQPLKPWESKVLGNGPAANTVHK